MPEAPTQPAYLGEIEEMARDRIAIEQDPEARSPLTGLAFELEPGGVSSTGRRVSTWRLDRMRAMRRGADDPLMGSRPLASERSLWPRPREEEWPRRTLWPPLTDRSPIESAHSIGRAM